MLGTDLKMSSSYHPQTDGATERANRTITQMLRQCIHPTQKDWAAKLPMIEFALNSARQTTTGLSPFYLNYLRVPYPMGVWKSQDPYPGVRTYAEKMKDAILTAHDAIIESRVKQTHQANKHRMPAPFKDGDLVYVSTKNMKIPKLRARKLMPKYIGPVRIEKVVNESSTYLVDLPADLKQRGIHPLFHASLLRPHIPNDDRRFPGRQLTQFVGFEEAPDEWAVDKIVEHRGKGRSAMFKLRWKTGDETWSEYRIVSKLDALKAYLEAQGVEKISELGKPDTPHTQIGIRTLNFHSGLYKAAGVPTRPFTIAKVVPPHSESLLKPSSTMSNNINNSAGFTPEQLAQLAQNPEFIHYVVQNGGQFPTNGTQMHAPSPQNLSLSNTVQNMEAAVAQNGNAQNGAGTFIPHGTGVGEP